MVDRERREGRWDRRERVREVSGRGWGWGEERGGYFLCWIELPQKLLDSVASAFHCLTAVAKQDDGQKGEFPCGIVLSPAYKLDVVFLPLLLGTQLMQKI